MSMYGCNYSIPRLLPSPKYFELVYNKCSRVFAVRETKPLVVESENSEATQGWYAARLQQQRELAAYGYSDIPVDPLSQLPTEVLHIIISFLDSSGLFCLSMTSQFLRETCHNAVKGNMVQLSWQKQEKDLAKVITLGSLRYGGLSLTITGTTTLFEFIVKYCCTKYCQEFRSYLFSGMGRDNSGK